MALKNHKEKQGKKFTPPLKKLVTSPALTLDYSCSEGASWSLPHTQTHTVLSYCNDKIDDLACPTPSQRKFSSKYRRHYQYSIHPPNTSRGNLKIQARAQTKGTNCTGLFNIYDYPLTPQNKTEMKVKPVRSKQQIEMDRIVLNFIAKTRAEIQNIRLNHLTPTSTISKQTNLHTQDSQYYNREE